VAEKNHEPRVIAEDSWFEGPAFSQDGKSIAVARVTDPSRPASIWIYDLESGGRRLFAESGNFPLWHDDDQAITFAELGVGIVTERLDDPKSRRTLVKHPQVIIPTQWIDEGKSLVYAAVNPETKGDAYILKIGGEARHLYSRGASSPNTTPDGRWLALCTWPRGVLVGKLPNFSSISVAAPGGCQPRWSSDGSKLYYAEYDKLWVVQVDSKASNIVFGKREVVFDFGLPGRFQYDVDQDDRIAIIQSSYDSPKPPVLMLNWRHKLDEI
jgi:Tol biopolymer transport system component